MEALLRQILVKLDKMETNAEQFQVEVRDRFDQIDKCFATIETRLGRLEQGMEEVDGHLDRIENDMVDVKGRLERVERELCEAKAALFRLENQVADDVHALLKNIDKKVEEKGFEIYAINKRLLHVEGAIEQIQSQE
ncbi:hypothetical protein [Parageobacillus toebii]|uniref:hypothetical protein n=1 Tax=Parageobacillus toebii TaxID=153151 RepID=UPI002814B323|nr:hypothetical protein [Parageobacillus toebii]WMT19782.1 hypothetical protein RFB12_04075 [Parageobacillus toebii]